MNAKKFRKIEPDKFEKLQNGHNCNINHTSSAPAVEVVGARNFLERSVKINKLRYTEFYGDSKGFQAVKNTFPGITITKRECFGHVQKRVDTVFSGV